MNKNELAVEMVKDSSITKSDAIKVLDAFVDVITAELTKKDAKITLVGFGTFKTIEKKQKKEDSSSLRIVATANYGHLITSCVACHSQFRKR